MLSSRRLTWALAFLSSFHRGNSFSSEGPVPFHSARGVLKFDSAVYCVNPLAGPPFTGHMYSLVYGSPRESFYERLAVHPGTGSLSLPSLSFSPSVVFELWATSVPF